MAKKIEFDFSGKKKSKKNLKKGLAIGAAFGATLGAVSGILLAPKSGKETRDQIKDDAKRASENIKTTANHVKETAERAGNLIIDKAKAYKKGKGCCKDNETIDKEVQVEAAAASENEEVK